MADRLLLEIYTEEIPSSFFAAGLLDQLQQAATAGLESAWLKAGEVKVYGTPRRLAVVFEDVPASQEPKVELVKGPPARVAWDAEGNPTKAALGFAKKTGVDPSALVRKQVEGGEYAFCERTSEGRGTLEIAGELFVDLVTGLHFPKTMRWNATGFRFGRPIRALVGLYGSDVVSFEVAGLSSGRTTWSHPFALKGRQRIQLQSADGYEAALKAHGVLVDHKERQRILLAGAERLAAEVGGVLFDREKTAFENTFLVEWPTAFCGGFSDDFLTLPRPILTTVMRKHQKYFPLVTLEGEPLPKFVGVRDGDDSSIEKVVHGNERVIKARLSDAAFYFENDRKQPLAARLEALRQVTFEQRLGTLYEKTQRLQALAEKLAKELALPAAEAGTLQRAAELAKCDLVTDMVLDFDELQGIMGQHYALLDGESEAVALAIGAQYMPRAAGDELPATRPGALLSLADKLDTVIGCLAVGYEATGSTDPFGLRRATYALVTLADKCSLDMDLLALGAAAYELLAEKARLGKAETLDAFAELVRSRLEAYLREAGLRYDTLNAILAGDFAHIHSACRRAQAVDAVREDESFAKLAVASTRPINIVRAALRKQQASAVELAQLPQVDLFREPLEGTLYEAFQKFAANYADLPEAEVDWYAYEQGLAQLVGVIDEFFDEVLVMDEDTAVQLNRLRLMQFVSQVLERLCDFTKLVI